MKPQQFIAGIFFGIFFTATLAATFQSPAPKPVKWEYKEECAPKNLQKLADEGWELVTATSSGVVTCLFLKRPKQ